MFQKQPAEQALTTMKQTRSAFALVEEQRVNLISES